MKAAPMLASLAATPPVLSADATEGAAPGYVEDRECASCHRARYDSFQDVGMAQSFRKPANARRIEDFDASAYYHEPSRRYYRIERDGDALWFERYQIAPDGERINKIRLQIDWVLGSGNRARSYLIQEPSGELFQLPLGWYTEIEAWRMSPGFDDPRHPGLQRQVQRECMFCHNAYPEVPAGSDRSFEPHLFPVDLPEGIGCQRCHGPGARHIEAARGGDALYAVRESIVNPRDLPPGRRNDVCFQCHMLPEVALTGPRVFGRAVYSFRPGQRQSDYQKHMEVELEGVSREENFQINHHAYRLIQSECFKRSDDSLTCISCHDPHRKPASGAFRRKVAEVCLGCHESPGHDVVVEEDECVRCHMPRRRTRDVVHVTMTDHRIARGPFEPRELLAPREETTPVLLDARLLDQQNRPPGPLPHVYRALATLKAGPSTDALDFLERVLPGMSEPPLTAVIRLAQEQIDSGRPDEALVTLRYAAQRDADPGVIARLQGVTEQRRGNSAKAIGLLEKAVNSEPGDPTVWYNLGLAYLSNDRDGEARDMLVRSLELRANNPRAWFYLALAETDLGHPDRAIDALEKALAYAPGYTRAYAEIARLLQDAGREAEARRYLAHGRRTARDPSQLPERTK